MRFLPTILTAIAVSGLAHAQVGKQAPPANKLQSVAQGVVWRISDRQDEHGHFLPPWKEVRIANIFRFNSKPAVGGSVTVIPLDVSILPFELKIIKAEKTQAGCRGESPAWWEVELEPVKSREFYETAALPKRAAEFPFDVAILYPAIKSARQITKEHLTAKMLPKEIAIPTVKAAIDITSDRQPDILLAEFCCKDTKKPAENCDLTCSKSFKKAGSAWQPIGSSNPC